jgi:hypothetical protein
MLQNVRNRLASLAQPSSSAAVRNYLTLRKLIGILGIALPCVMWLGEPVLCPGAGGQPTISHYYYTLMRDAFVGILWALGIFLVCYRGTRRWDDLVSTFAGLFAIIVALFPTKPRWDAASYHCVIPSAISAKWQVIDNIVHYSSAALFFLAITCMALFLFKNRGKHSWTNPFYKICGAAMLACLLWMWFGGVSFLKELIAVEAFGAAWLVNGIGMFKDPQDRPLSNGHAPKSEFA